MCPGGQGVTERVVEAVADHTDTDVMDLPPLFDSIDPEALDRVVRSMNDGEISFVYADLRITVDSHGAIRVEDSSSEGNSEE